MFLYQTLLLFLLVFIIFPNELYNQLYLQENKNLLAFNLNPLNITMNIGRIDNFLMLVLPSQEYEKSICLSLFLYLSEIFYSFSHMDFAEELLLL